MVRWLAGASLALAACYASPASIGEGCGEGEPTFLVQSAGCHLLALEGAAPVSACFEGPESELIVRRFRVANLLEEPASVRLVSGAPLASDLAYVTYDECTCSSVTVMPMAVAGDRTCFAALPLEAGEQLELAVATSDDGDVPLFVLLCTRAPDEPARCP